MRSLKEKLTNGSIVKNGWISNATLLSCEIFSRAGYDSITVDLQHGLIDYTRMLEGLSGIAPDVTSIVRVAWNQPAYIQKALDAGAMGIICPMINHAEEAQTFVKSVYYPPLGERSIGPVRASVIHDQYVKRANLDTLAIAMIETPTAVQNLDAILDVQGIDGVYVGPSDLGLTHGFGPGVDRSEPELLQIMDHIISRAKAHNKFAGLHTVSPHYSLQAMERGFQFVTAGSDVLAMKHGLAHIFDVLG